MTLEDKPHRDRQKDPKVPTFPETAHATAQKLHGIIDAHGPQAPLAYAALSRLSVLWTNDVEPVNKTAMVNRLVSILSELFPDSEGLETRDGL